jgi:Tfp pilus assembly protein PilN
MIELNLLPDVKKEFIRAQRTRNTVISGAILVCIIAAGVTALLATTVYGAQKILIENLKKEISSNHQKLESKQEINKYLTVQSQLKYLDETAQQRSVYARLFDYLPQLNPAVPSNVTLFRLTLDKEASTIEISGSAASFEAVNNFRYTLERALFTYVAEDGTTVESPLFTSISNNPPSLSTSKNGKAEASFQFVVTYNEEAFDPSTKDIKIIVPKITTSDSDQNAPKELFGVDPQTTQEADDGQQ